MSIRGSNARLSCTSYIHIYRSLHSPDVFLRAAARRVLRSSSRNALTKIVDHERLASPFSHLVPAAQRATSHAARERVRNEGVCT